MTYADWFYVGLVRFDGGDEVPDDQVRCSACDQVMPRSAAADHARVRHRAKSLDVLPGQLGLPGTRTPDVPGRR